MQREYQESSVYVGSGIQKSRLSFGTGRTRLFVSSFLPGLDGLGLYLSVTFDHISVIKNREANHRWQMHGASASSSSPNSDQILPLLFCTRTQWMTSKQWVVVAKSSSPLIPSYNGLDSMEDWSVQEYNWEECIL